MESSTHPSVNGRMFMINPPGQAFITVPCILTSQFSRRPGTHSCRHRGLCFQIRSKRALHATMQAKRPDDEPTNSNLKPMELNEKMEKMASSSGFALRDAREYTFSDFAIDETPFQSGGAYAISDPKGQVVYMGYSRNVAAKLAFHARLQPQSCSSFRMYVPPVPPELISPDMLENVLEYWVREIGDVPRGNTVDRALWEQENPINRKSETTKVHAANANAVTEDSDIPVRDRSTEPRTSSRTDYPRYESADPFADAFRSSSTRAGSQGRKRTSSNADGWNPSKEDFVEVEVDPFDPFSASNRRASTRSSWSEVEEEAKNEDWYPIAMIMGFAGLLWLFGVMSNALPAATPSLGM